MTDTKDQAMLWMLECVNIRIFMEKVSRPKYVRSSSLSISRLWGQGTRQNRKGKAVKKEKRLCFIPAQNVKSPLLLTLGKAKPDTQDGWEEMEEMVKTAK